MNDEINLLTRTYRDFVFDIEFPEIQVSQYHTNMFGYGYSTYAPSICDREIILRVKLPFEKYKEMFNTTKIQFVLNDTDIKPWLNEQIQLLACDMPTIEFTFSQYITSPDTSIDVWKKRIKTLLDCFYAAAIKNVLTGKAFEN